MLALIAWLTLTGQLIMAADVMPMRWQPAAAEGPLTEYRQKVYEVVENQARYLISTTRPWEGDPTLRLLTDSKHGEHWIRPNTGTVAGLAFLYRFGPYNAERVGVSREQLLSNHIIPMMRYLVVTHKTGTRPTSNGKPWGDHWQSAHWAHMLGRSAWWIWEDLPEDLQRGIQSIMAHEADRIAAAKIPHRVKNDTKSEENGWNSQVISIAMLLLPDDPRNEVWREAFPQWAISAHLRASDATCEVIVDDRPVKDWFLGANIHEDFTLENHNIIHPDYMTCYSLGLGCALDYRMTGRAIPEALLYNVPQIYENIKWFILPDGGFVYPSGQDWRLFRNPDWHFKHVLMAVYANDPDAWSIAMRGIDTMVKMQSRPNGGAVYAPGEYFFPSAQMDLIYYTSLTWLLLHEVDELPLRPDLYTGVRRLDGGKLMLNRTPSAVHTLSWGNKIMIQAVPNQLDRIVSPHFRSGIGHVRIEGNDRAPSPKLRDIEIENTDNAFKAKLVVDHGDAIRSQITVESQPDGTFTFSEELTALKDVTTTEVGTGLIGILNNPTWVYERGYRSLTIDNDATHVPSCSGMAMERSGIHQVNIDDVLFIDSADRMNVRYASEPKPVRGRVTDHLYLNWIPGRKQWQAGQPISTTRVTIQCATNGR
ncbi:hypothetical protein [Mucisphaera calidilacus]|uniref:hypothetical protein n=1 Tax=Mucisphaera calidilacus TaxID=2527982 RepID=UPI0011A97D1C|nr:hypothetical protein [Mucisphaera calidilacus]